MIKNIKRAFVLGMTSLILFTGLPATTVHAADSAPVHTKASVSGKATNQTVTYKLDLNKVKVSDGRVAVTFDPEVLTLVKAKGDVRFDEKDFNEEYVAGEEEGVSYAFVNESAKNVKGSLLSLTFKVNAGVENQDTVVKTKVFTLDNEETEILADVVLEDTVNVGRPKPVTPQNVTASQTLLGVNVQWKKDANADGYVVYRSTSKNGKYSAVATTTGTYYLDLTLRNNTTYYYKVQAYQKQGKDKIYSDFSNPVSIKVKKFFGIFG